PDLFSTGGQDWGLAPVSPAAIARNDGETWRQLLGEAMRDAGALRLDHAMSLRQQFWIPAGSPATEGGFIRYPMATMLEGLAELSHARQVVIIGEDLGHVPEGFRETMAAARILSYRILYFEKSDEAFVRPPQWPALALACL